MSTVKEKFDIIISKLDAIERNFSIGEYSKESVGIDYSEVSEHGGIRLEEVEQLRSNWLLSGDKLKVKVAQNTPEWYCFRSPNATYSEDVENQIHANQQRLWATHGEENIDYMYNMLPLFRDKKTGAVKWSQPTQWEKITGSWVKVQKRLNGIVKNHSVVDNGNFSNPDDPRWQTELRDRIGEWVERKMTKDYGNLIRS